MGFPNVREYAESFASKGSYWQSFLHKTGSPILPAAGWWGDLSMAAGTPKYNAYVGVQGQGTPLVGSGNFGIYAGESVSPATKHLNRLAVSTNSATFAPAKMVLCDYVYFIPLVDMDSTDVQTFDNATNPMPRFEHGRDLNMMLVTTTPQTATASCTVTYTNQDGVSGQTATFNVLGPSNVGNCNSSLSTAAGGMNPFLPLAQGDYGVQSIDSLQMASSAGGFCALVLARPLASVLIRETNTVCEHFFLKHKPSLPVIDDGAYLSFVFSSGVAATSSVIRGELEVYWG
jgi:hypothetical protein